MSITKIGRDIAEDPCWHLPKVQREALSEDEKNANCPCMGINMFNASRFGKVCYFPGLQQFYKPELDSPKPVKPVEPEKPGDPPTQPALPPQPTQPPPGDVLAQQQYVQDVNAWQEQVNQVNDDFRRQFEDYQQRVDAFQAASDKYQQEVETYQHDITEWQGTRSAAFGSGENLLGRLWDQFGSTYDVDIVSRWMFQIGLTCLLFLGILILQKRKDVI